MKESVGFVGLGIMGRGMVKNLVANGYDVNVFARDTAKARAFSEKTLVSVQPSLEELATRSSVVMLCVTETEDVREVLLGRRGLLSYLQPGSLVIDCSTISPAASAEFGAALSDRRIGFVDAPVSGGSEGAERGTLSVMAGGNECDFNRALPLLRAVGARITHMGPVGSGQSTKLLNQILVVVNMLAVSEALLFGKAAGLDLDRAVSAVEQGAAGSWMLSNRASQVLNNYWEPGFTVDLQQKDLRLVLEAARDSGVALLATGLIHQLYTKLQSQGKGGLGNHALVQALEGFAGITL